MYRGRPAGARALSRAARAAESRFRAFEGRSGRAAEAFAAHPACGAWAHSRGLAASDAFEVSVHVVAP